MKCSNRAMLFAALGTCTFMVMGCVQPLGPGFHFAGRQTEIRPVEDLPGKLHIRVVDHLENAGDRRLQSLEVRLPDSPNFKIRNLRTSSEGKEIVLEHSSIIDTRKMRATLDPPWDQKQLREIATEWDLVPEPSSHGTLAASVEAFHVTGESAFPLWQAPVGVFSTGSAYPANQVLTVFASPDFRILAPGKPLKSKKSLTGLTPQVFRIRQEKDFSPYVVAGRYQQQIVSGQYGSVIFWTIRPLDSEAGKTAAPRIASSMRALADFFGPLSKGKSVVHIVEVPGLLPSEFDDTGNFQSGEIDALREEQNHKVNSGLGGASFPEGVLLDSRAIAQGVGDEAVLRLSEYELAQTWFGWRVYPDPKAQILMGRGVGLFGLVIAAEARGFDQRQRMVASLLDRYDQARATAVDKRLLEPQPGYSRAERISTGYRAVLFLVELEDLCGHDNMRAAFHEIIRSRAVDAAGYEELRAALESSSKRNLADLFRNWLNQPGVPAEFRGRYAKQ
jgi:hypothetical protein